MSVLLIYPPFAAPNIPPLGIASLSSYLASEGIEATSLDANIAFFRWLLSPERVSIAKEYAAERSGKLNQKESLSLDQKLELTFLVKALTGIKDPGEELEKILDHSVSLSPAELTGVIRAMTTLLTLSHFPEILDIPGWPFIRFTSPFDIYSSGDIVAGAEKDGLFDDFFEHLLSPLFEQKSYKLVGISVCFPNQIMAAFRCARTIKRIEKDAHVVLGGTFITAHFAEVKEKDLLKYVDSMVIGDGEIPLRDLIRELGTSSPDLSRVPGLLYLDNERIKRNALAEPLPMDRLPIPNYTVFPLEGYLFPKKYLWLPFRLSRGCSWGRCAFCRTDLVSYCERHSVDHIVESLLSIVERTGIRNFNFTDDEAPADLLIELGKRLIREDLRVKWTVETRFDPRLTSENCRLFYNSGCRSIFFGLESFNNRVLGLMQKGITTDLIDKILENVKGSGIKVLTFMIVGFPTETEDEALRGFSEIQGRAERGLIQNIIYTKFRILHNSPVAKNPERFSIQSIPRTEGRDLFPPLYYFEADGMSCRSAFELESRFNGGGTTSFYRPSDLILPRIHTGINFDVNDIFSDAEKALNYIICFGKWPEETKYNLDF
jgi:anaerobic magnesium-protoporphyrin IX monomethyl ester cyclase